MGFQETIDWLEAQPERVVNGKTLPARAGAVCRSDEHFTAQKTALEQACALLKNRCTPEMQEALDNLSSGVAKNQKESMAVKRVQAEERALLHK